MNSPSPRSSAPVVRGSFADGPGEAVCVHVPDHFTGEQPVVNLHRENDIVKSIEIICPCGQRVHLLCQYENDQNEVAP